MFSKSETLSHYSKINIVIWLCMAFEAGAINAGALLACHKYVTHTTGFATAFGAELARGHMINAVSFLSLPFIFMLGAMASAFWVDHRIQTDKRPLYPLVMGLIFILLLTVLFGGQQGRFGDFGSPLDILNHFILLLILAFASGVLNGTVTSACGAVIRITHMTGLTTDLGIGIVRVLTKSHRLNSRENEIRANLNRIFIFCSFAAGAGVSSWFFLRWGYSGFVLPCLLSAGLFIWSLIRFFRPNTLSSPQSIHIKEMIQSK